MKDFSNPAEFATYLEHMLRILPVAQAHGLGLATAALQKEAKSEIGHYQDAVGPVEAWPELADATKADRLDQGYSENDPLLRSGELRDSIHRNFGAYTAYVGSDLDIAVYQELGTDRIPARSFLAGAAVRKGDEAVEFFKDAIVGHLIGRATLYFSEEEENGD